MAPLHDNYVKINNELNDDKTGENWSEIIERQKKANQDLRDEARKHGILKSPEEYGTRHDLLNAKDLPSKLHEHLSHGHEDPQHAIHSAVNALGRKLGTKSISMDTPEDQAHQSGLESEDYGDPEDMDYPQFREDAQAHVDDRFDEDEFEGLKNPPDGFYGNPNLVSALNKMTHKKMKNALMEAAIHSNPSDKIMDYLDESTLTNPEKDAIREYTKKFMDNGPELYGGDYGNYSPNYSPDPSKFDLSSVPVHQQQTYHQRPKKLGMKRVDKSKLLGEDPNDKAKEVQYMNLHKKLQFILEELRKTKK
jgi:hypothetical protein